MGKKIILSILAIQLLITLQAQTTKEPKIEFLQVVYNYDTITQGSNGECIFIYKNIGNAPLVISKLSSSCGCTIPKYNKKPTMPNDTDTIKVKYNTSQLGSFRKTIVVKSNAINEATVVLTIKGVVVKNKK